MRGRSQTGVGFGYGLTSGLLWGLGAVLLGQALTLPPLAGAALFAAPLAAAAIHDGLGAVWVVGAGLACGRRRALTRAVRSRDGAVIAAAALLGGPLSMSAYLTAIDLAGAGYGAAVAACAPALAALIGRFTLGDVMHRRGWIGIAVALAGSAVAGWAPPPGGRPAQFALGMALAFVAALGWALEAVLVTRAMQRVPADVALAIREAVSAVVYIAVILPAAGALGLAGRALVSNAGLWLAAASVAGAAAYLTYYRALDLIGPARAMPANATYVLWAVGLGALLFGTPTGPTLVLAAVLLPAGVALVASDRCEGAPAAGEAGAPPAASGSLRP